MCTRSDKQCAKYCPNMKHVKVRNTDLKDNMNDNKRIKQGCNKDDAVF